MPKFNKPKKSTIALGAIGGLGVFLLAGGLPLLYTYDTQGYLFIIDAVFGGSTFLLGAGGLAIKGVASLLGSEQEETQQLLDPEQPSVQDTFPEIKKVTDTSMIIGGQLINIIQKTTSVDNQDKVAAEQSLTSPVLETDILKQQIVPSLLKISKAITSKEYNKNSLLEEITEIKKLILAQIPQNKQPYLLNWAITQEERLQSHPNTHYDISNPGSPISSTNKTPLFFNETPPSISNSLQQPTNKSTDSLESTGSSLGGTGSSLDFAA